MGLRLCAWGRRSAGVSLTNRVLDTMSPDTRARLQWWFQQSNYEAPDAGRYPIVRIWDKNW